MSTPYALVAIGVACFFGVLAVYMVVMDLFLRDKSRIDDRLNEEFRAKQRERAKKTSLFKNFQELGQVAGDFGGESLVDQYQTMIDQAGFEELTVQKVAVFSLFTALPPAIILFIPFGLIGSLVGFLIGGIIPTAYIRYKKNARLNKLRSQLPDTFDLMARIIRAGQTMTQAMQAVSDEFEPPISIEFAFCSEMMNLGISPEAALQDMARRSGIIELKIFVLGLLIQRETGGNLAEMLDNLSKVVRERFRINGQIATLTAEGRMQAAVLMCLPPGMLVIMLLLNPTYTQELIDQPMLILGMFVSEFLGWLWIRKIVNFDF